MAYVKVTPPSVVYHLTRMENLDSVLDDGKIRRFEDSECWFCESLPTQCLRAQEAHLRKL